MRQRKLHAKENNAWRCNRCCRSTQTPRLQIPGQHAMISYAISYTPRPQTREIAYKLLIWCEISHPPVKPAEPCRRFPLQKAENDNLRQFCAFHSHFRFTCADREKNSEISQLDTFENRGFLPKLDYRHMVLRIFIYREKAGIEVRQISCFFSAE
jgi:hypothetical protein